MDPLRLIVGLGNPGSQYERTRHNAGFSFVDLLGQRFHGRLHRESRFSADVGRILVEGHELWLLQPQTYMNRSGLAVRPFVDFYKIPLHCVLVAHDEIDLAPGDVRLKMGGGHGGHNGLRDLSTHLGPGYWRLRLGVGHPGHRDLVADYVLSRASREDQALIDAGLERAAAVLPMLVRGEFAKAQQTLNTSPQR